MTTDLSKLTIKLDTTNLEAAVAKVGRALIRFGRALGFSTHIPHQQPPIAGGRGAAYRARARRRTRSRR